MVTTGVVKSSKTEVIFLRLHACVIACLFSFISILIPQKWPIKKISIVRRAASKTVYLHLGSVHILMLQLLR